METLGAYLKKNREDKGVSLEEMASATKINISVLSYLENDKYDTLPAPIFVRGFIRTYLKYLGVDPKEAILFYELFTASPKKAEDKVNAIGSEKSTKFKITDSTIITILSISVVVLLILVYHFYSKSSGQAAKVDNTAGLLIKMRAEVKPTTQTQSPNQNINQNTNQNANEVRPNAVSTTVPVEELLPVATTQQTQPAQQQEPTQRVTIKTEKDLWVKAQLDDGAIFDFLLRSGGVKKLEAKKEIKILLGDASAAVIEYNGEAISDLGSKGHMRSIVFPGLGKWKDAVQVQ